MPPSTSTGAEKDKDKDKEREKEKKRPAPTPAQGKSKSNPLASNANTTTTVNANATSTTSSGGSSFASRFFSRPRGNSTSTSNSNSPSPSSSSSTPTPTSATLTAVGASSNPASTKTSPRLPTKPLPNVTPGPPPIAKSVSNPPASASSNAPAPSASASSGNTLGIRFFRPRGHSTSTLRPSSPPPSAPTPPTNVLPLKKVPSNPLPDCVAIAGENGKSTTTMSSPGPMGNDRALASEGGGGGGAGEIDEIDIPVHGFPSPLETSTPANEREDSLGAAGVPPGTTGFFLTGMKSPTSISPSPSRLFAPMVHSTPPPAGVSASSASSSSSSASPKPKPKHPIQLIRAESLYPSPPPPPPSTLGIPPPLFPSSVASTSPSAASSSTSPQPQVQVPGPSLDKFNNWYGAGGIGTGKGELESQRPGYRRPWKNASASSSSPKVKTRDLPSLPVAVGLGLGEPSSSSPTALIPPEREGKDLALSVLGFHTDLAPTKSATMEQSEGWVETRDKVKKALHSVLGYTLDITHEVLEIGSEVLELAPIPGLAEAAKVLLSIWDALQAVDMNRLACLRLTSRCADILFSVREEIVEAGEQVAETLVGPIGKLVESFVSVHTFLIKQIHRPFLKRYLKRDEILREIGDCDKKLGDSLSVFSVQIQIRILQNIQQSENRRREDEKKMLGEIKRQMQIYVEEQKKVMSPGVGGGLTLGGSEDVDEEGKTPTPAKHVPLPEMALDEKTPSPSNGSSSQASLKTAAPSTSASASASDTHTHSHSSSTSALSSIQSSLEALRTLENTNDANSDAADLRALMRAALGAASDSELIGVLQVGRDEMPEAIKALQRALERVDEDDAAAAGEESHDHVGAGEEPGEEGTQPQGLGLEFALNGGRKATMDSFVSTSTSTTTTSASGERDPDRTLDREFMESGIDALRRMSLSHNSQLHPSDLSLPPWTITRYEVDRERRIGIGFFSDVYYGTYRERGVAIKVLSPLTTNRELFVKEVRIWKKLRHENVLELIGASSAIESGEGGEGGGGWFFVSPYWRNGSLVQFLRRVVGREHSHSRERERGGGKGKEREAGGSGDVGGHLTPGGHLQQDVDLLKMMYEIAKGMEYLHARGVLHGDLKGTNVLVDDKLRCVISDFGQSELKSEAYRVSGAKPPHGTLRWQAPELIQGHGGGRLTTEMDVYAFAICCIEVLSMGRMPWPYWDDEIVRYNVLEKNARPDIPLTRYTTPSLGDLIKKCWNADPFARPTFSKIVRDLKILRAGVGMDKNGTGVVTPTPGIPPTRWEDEMKGGEEGKRGRVVVTASPDMKPKPLPFPLMSPSRRRDHSAQPTTAMGLGISPAGGAGSDQGDASDVTAESYRTARESEVGLSMSVSPPVLSHMPHQSWKQRDSEFSEMTGSPVDYDYRAAVSHGAVGPGGKRQRATSAASTASIAVGELANLNAKRKGEHHRFSSQWQHPFPPSQSPPDSKGPAQRKESNNAPNAGNKGRRMSVLFQPRIEDTVSSSATMTDVQKIHGQHVLFTPAPSPRNRSPNSSRESSVSFDDDGTSSSTSESGGWSGAESVGLLRTEEPEPMSLSAIGLGPSARKDEDGVGKGEHEEEGYRSPPPPNERIALARNERRYRLLLTHEFHPSLVLPLWKPTPIQLGAVGYLSKPTGEFVTLFNSFSPLKTSNGNMQDMPSIYGYGRVNMGSQRQDRRNVAQRGIDAIAGLLTFAVGSGSGSGLSQSVSRRYSYPLRAGHKCALLCTETTMYRYVENLDAPKKWFKANVEDILKAYGGQHRIQKEDLFLVIGTLNSPDYALFVSHSHPDAQAHFNVLSGQPKGAPWGTFTIDTELAAEIGGPSYDEPITPNAQNASTISDVGGPWNTLLIARLRFKPDAVEPTSRR